MDLLTIGIIGFVICGVIGAACASSKDRAGAGFFLGLLFGPLGIIIALIMPGNATGPAPDQKEIQEGKTLLSFQEWRSAWIKRDAANKSLSIDDAHKHYKAYKEDFHRREEASKAAATPPPAATAPSLRIARGGEDLGDKDLPAVKLMVKTGQLTLEDYFYSSDAQDWLPLSSHPSFA